jgi:hypothetical protein
MNEFLTERGVGLELVQREVASILYDELNPEIDLQQELWEDRDFEWNQKTGQESETIIEHIDPQNFEIGHKPSLIKDPIPIDRYPNVASIVYQSNPSDRVIDQATNMQPILDIEVLIKGETETQCDRRIHRTTEAIHQVMTRNENLNGLSLGWGNDPTITITDLFVTPYEGKDWFYQGARIRYNLTRHTNLPTIDQL